MTRHKINSSMISQIVCNSKWAASSASFLMLLRKNGSPEYEVTFRAYARLFWTEFGRLGTIEETSMALLAYIIKQEAAL